MTHIQKIFGGLAAVALLVGAGIFSQTASAGPLATTSEAYQGVWQGSSNLVGTTIAGTVDYAVFGPGAFQDFLDTEFAGDGYVDPTGGSEFVYAFQVRSNVGRIQTLHAGYDFGADLGSLASPQTLVASGSTGPGTKVFNSTSARWDWGFANFINTGVTSDILYYTSDQGPKPDRVTIGARFFAEQVDSGLDFASPVPEPTSVVLGALGIACVLAGGLRKREHLG